MDVQETFEHWSDGYRRAASDGTELLWPSETLVRLFKGDYIPDAKPDLRGDALLDVGAGNGNNDVFFASLGLRLFGSEVTERLARDTQEKLSRLGVQMDIAVGTNRRLPYPDSSFDHLVSWNVIHYEQDDDAIAEAVAEYARVLKPGGRCYVSTTGPEHRVLLGAERVGPRRYRIAVPNDLRRGQVMYCFETADAVNGAFARSFDDVLVGRTLDRLLTHTLDWFIVTGVRA